MKDNELLLGAVLGTLVTIAINVLSNLITPDRERLVDGARNWWASRSNKRTKERIQELETELKMLSNYAENPQLLSLYFWHTIFRLLIAFCTFPLLFVILESASTAVPPILMDSGSPALLAVLKIIQEWYPTFLGLTIIIVIGMIITWCQTAIRLSSQISSYDQYTEHIRQRIAEFQEKISGFSNDFSADLEKPSPGMEIVTPDGPERIPAKISLQASNGQYVCAEGDGKVVADRAGIGEWETFELIALEGDKIALRAWNGQYVSAEDADEVIANQDEIREWETFELIALEGEEIALRARNGQYVCAEGGGGHHVVANRDERSRWETFRLITHDRPH